MKIIYLTPGCFDKGGISRYNRYQITALRELKGSHNVKVCSLHGRKPDDFEEPFDVDFAGGGIGAISKIRFVLFVVKNFFFWQPDIIWIGHVNLSGMAYLLSRISGVRVVLNTYGLEVWSGLTKDAAYGLRKAHYVISDCHFTARYLEDEQWRSRNSVVVIWDCVDLKRFFPAEASKEALTKYGIPDPIRHQLIVTLGRMAKVAAHKGYDRLIRTFAKIHQKFPVARLVLAGKGDWMEELKLLVDNVGLTSKVTFTGMVDEKHLVDIYRSAYVFSLVSDRGKGRGEGIPLTPLEAMACGAPVIVGNQDGSQEAVTEELNGFVIDPFDLEAHATRLSALLADRHLRQEKSLGAIQRVHNEFAYEGFREKHKLFLQKYFTEQ
ncbi:MAG: glycosyltransferase family 4 protein [Bacteroidetes bacterium]|nr:glycosyltransferase family 4 protein [Bacteroidota bacterium]